MKQLYLLSAIILFTIRAAVASTAFPDTLAGHAQLVSKMAQTMCLKLEEENAKRPLQQFSTAESKELVTRLMFTAMGEHNASLMPLLSQASAKGLDENAMGKQIGKDVMMRVIEHCNVARPMVMQMGLSEMKDKPVIEDFEKPLLQKMAADICQRLDEQEKASPSAKLTPEQRKERLIQTSATSAQKHQKELTKLYGKKLNQGDFSNTVGRKVAVVIANICPNYLLQVGLDASKEQAGK